MTGLPKTFDPAAIEARWYAHWESEGRFRPERPDAPPFTIVMPPPNVTGSLHIGHALDVTLQDILVRHARLQGKDALWIAGTDHAGIATQMVVERNLASQGVKRTDMTREQFVEHVWEWKAESGGAITRQLRRLGASCDWSREQFTMDPHFCRAVNKVFIDLYNQGLLYRDKRLVNWDPGLKTAISDLEVEQREVNGKFWHFRYPLEDGSGFIAIATTRPETILGDGAVAVHPDDPKYAHLVGKRCLLPIVNRLIPIITDAHVKMDFGSGAVKITAAHDWNDYEVAMRHPEANIPLINLMNADATMSDNCPPEYRGLDRYAAREKVVADFDALGLLDKVEDHVHMVPFGDRSGVVIEPWLTDQWYVDAKTLAGPAIDAVRSAKIKVVPATWKKTWFQWLENIQPWCVSRQLWWGHRIPAWYGVKKEVYERADFDEPLSGPLFAFHDGFIVVAGDEEDARAQFADYYGITADQIRFAQELPEGGWQGRGGGRTVYRDRDVLDTWFSSALWPFGTLGWPDADPKALPLEREGWERVDRAQDLSADARKGALPRPQSLPAGEGSLLAKHYPNDVLISGFDILFFWDARMAMQGLHFMGEVPWKTLYLHGLVRAPDGAKMSKSKGNTVDPLGLIDKYGADALRFTLAAMESQGRDIKLDEKRVEGYRNFATKLWNAARFCQANGIGASASIAAPAADLAVNRWIIGEVVETLAKLDKAVADFRYDEAANTLYHFVWDRFCDWYLELIKGELGDETKAVAGWVFDQILVMLHPLMPFITEELWHAMGVRPYDLILARWPEPHAAVDGAAAHEIEWLIGLVSDIRTARTELNVPVGAKLDALVWVDGENWLRLFERQTGSLRRLARVAKADIIEKYLDDDVGDPKLGEPGLQTHAVQIGANVQIFVEGATVFLALENIIDFDAERTRLGKGIDAATKEAEALAKRLDNPAFVERAKPEAVAKARADHAEKSDEAERLRAALARLG